MRKVAIVIMLIGVSGCVPPMHFLKDRACLDDSKGTYYYPPSQYGTSPRMRTDAETQRYLECKRKIKVAKGKAQTRNTVVTIVSMVGVVGSAAALVAGVAAASGGSKGGGGGCPKCKKTITRSDGITQSYWACC